MARQSANPALRQIQTLYALGSLGGLTDAELVERFLDRDGSDREDAFAALVHRHGPMVLGVCRRMLRGPASADAEDAFQAVFLVLVRRAGAVRGFKDLKSWLYGVAVRTANEARRRSARRRAREGGTMDESRAVSAPDEGRRDRLDLRDRLDEELGRLPVRFRDPLVLCELEGMSRRDAARRLGLPEGTLSSRLARGRSLLRDRLARRGVTLGTGLLAAMLPEPANAALPGPLAAATVRLASSFAAGVATAGSVPAARLARAVVRAMSPWARTIPAAVLASGLVAAALAGWVGASGGAKPAVRLALATPVVTAAPGPATAPAPEDPLPAGATLRFGSPRFRHPTTIENLAVSADGTFAVASSGTRIHGAVRAYDLATGRVRCTFDNANDVEAVALSPDGQTIATTTVRNQAVYLHDTTSGREIGRIDYPAANPSTTSGALVFSPDGKRIVVAAATGKGLHLIDLTNRAIIRTFPHADVVFAAAFSPDGKYLVAGGYESAEDTYYARLREVDEHRELYRLPFGHGGIRCVAYSPDGATVAVGGDGWKSLAVKLFDAATGKERLAIPFPDGRRVRSVAFSPDGRTLAASSHASTRLFDAATGQERLKIDRAAIGLRFAPDGATLVGAVAGTIYRWDSATGRSLIPEGGDSPVAQVAATPDGRRIVTLGQDGDGHVWDTRTGGHERRVEMSWQRGFALSPDGRFLAWAVADDSIQYKDPGQPNLTHTGSRLRMIDVATARRSGGSTASKATPTTCRSSTAAGSCSPWITIAETRAFGSGTSRPAVWSGRSPPTRESRRGSGALASRPTGRCWP